MSDYLDVACPACHVPAGSLCVNASREPMILGHRSRRWAAVTPDGDLGPDDPDDTIPPLDSLPVPPEVSPASIPPADNYGTLTVLRWAQEYEDITYIYVAIKIIDKGWYLTGKETVAIPWDVLWNRHLNHALWIESATTWSTVRT